MMGYISACHFFTLQGEILTLLELNILYTNQTHNLIYRAFAQLVHYRTVSDQSLQWVAGSRDYGTLSRNQLPLVSQIYLCPWVCGHWFELKRKLGLDGVPR